MNNWYVYILQCSDGSLYTGVTKDINRRLRQHNGEITGGAKYTAMHQPVQLVYRSQHPDRSCASIEESRIKKLSRKEKIQLIK